MCLSYLSIHCTQCSSTWWGWNNDEIARTEECECTNKIRRKRWHEGATATGWIRRRMLCPLQILDYLYCRWTLPQRSPNEIKEEDCLSCMQAYYGLTQAPNYQLQSLHASFFFSFCLVEINIFILLGKTIYTTNKAQGILQWSRYNFFSLRTTNNVKPISTKQKQQGSGYKSSLWAYTQTP